MHAEEEILGEHLRCPGTIVGLACAINFASLAQLVRPQGHLHLHDHHQGSLSLDRGAGCGLPDVRDEPQTAGHSGSRSERERSPRDSQEASVVRTTG